jgi:hypothetical protein
MSGAPVKALAGSASTDVQMKVKRTLLTDLKQHAARTEERRELHALNMPVEFNVLITLLSNSWAVFRPLLLLAEMGSSSRCSAYVYREI